ncbi:hypothetical protein NPIL_219831 [Nephila pilipes]|uniref:Uncharacterized protein n=1 Tax=Nephila pilipes TaxID=299642 RepID=A0A8X6QD16_NEPPI|nr:hypothetical protein NPIL_219831 [Nephila pilipes]
MSFSSTSESNFRDKTSLRYTAPDFGLNNITDSMKKEKKYSKGYPPQKAHSSDETKWVSFRKMRQSAFFPIEVAKGPLVYLSERVQEV